VAKQKTTERPIRYIVTIEDITTGELTRRTGATLKAAIIMAQEAHQAVGQESDTPLLDQGGDK